MKLIGTCIFLSTQCDVFLGRYAIKAKSAKRSAPYLGLTDSATGEPMATASVNMPDVYDPAPGEVIIKDYSENEGILKALQEAGIVGSVLRTLPAGYVEVYVCQLLIV